MHKCLAVILGPLVSALLFLPHCHWVPRSSRLRLSVLHADRSPLAWARISIMTHLSAASIPLTTLPTLPHLCHRRPIIAPRATFGPLPGIGSPSPFCCRVLRPPPHSLPLSLSATKGHRTPHGLFLLPATTCLPEHLPSASTISPTAVSTVSSTEAPPSHWNSLNHCRFLHSLVSSAPHAFHPRLFN
jgi:hypothetical protein